MALRASAAELESAAVSKSSQPAKAAPMTVVSATMMNVRPRRSPGLSIPTMIALPPPLRWDHSPWEEPASARNNGDLLLAQCSHHLRIQFQVRFHQIGRRERHPLVQRYVGVVAALEDLEKPQLRIAGVLDVVTHGKRYVADIARLIVERTGLTGRAKHTHARLALDVVLPFVVVW